jgi:hypothetical protein
MTNKVAGWIAGLGAIVAALLVLWNQFGDVRASVAQEATKAGREAAVEYMQPMQQELVDIRMAQERDFIEKKWDQCMQYSLPEADVDQRRIFCDDEKDWRWEHWEWEMCVERAMDGDEEIEIPEDAIPECGVEPRMEGQP